jgi:hypothetical protein
MPPTKQATHSIKQHYTTRNSFNHHTTSIKQSQRQLEAAMMMGQMGQMGQMNQMAQAWTGCFFGSLTSF